MSAAGHDGELPSPWIARFTPMIEPGQTVLDVACGGGRHARWFAARGCRVTAVDRDDGLLQRMHGQPLIETLAADLESGPWPLGARRFDAVIVANYLHRPLFPALLAALAPNGLLLYETFAVGNAMFGKPSNPAFLLQPGELLQRTTALRVIAFEDGTVSQPRPAFIQRIAARNVPAASELPVGCALLQ